jgi:hypothetical protein
MNQHRNKFRGPANRGNKSVRPSRRHRGTAFILVIAMGMLVAAASMAALMAARVTARTESSANDWDEAGTLATAGVEHALSFLNAAASASPTGWRAGYVNLATALTQNMGRGTFSWALKDEVDGNLQESYLRPFRIYGVGAVNSVTRVYSVQVIPGGSPLDVLRTAMHAAGTVQLNGQTFAGSGPISSNTSVSLGGQIYAAIEAPATTGPPPGPNSSIQLTVPAPTKTMPLADVFTEYSANATAFPYTAIETGASGSANLQKCLLSAAVNPYGATASNGVYLITMTKKGTLTITNCRICATLLISAPAGSQINLQGPVLWEPAQSNYPSLIITGSNLTVQFTGSNNWLSEASAQTNLNPASNPFEGNSDTNMTDWFPPQYRGVFHVIGSSNTVQVQGNAYIHGTLITDGTIQTNGPSTAVEDSKYYSKPPYGYAIGNQLTIVPGSWRWDTLP